MKCKRCGIEVTFKEPHFCQGKMSSSEVAFIYILPSSNNGVGAKTEDIERVIGRLYVEAKKLENVGVQNNFGETDWYYDRMKVLADKLIEREET